LILKWEAGVGYVCLSYGYFSAVFAAFLVLMINAKTLIIFAQIVGSRSVHVNIRHAVDEFNICMEY